MSEKKENELLHDLRTRTTRASGRRFFARVRVSKNNNSSNER